MIVSNCGLCGWIYPVSFLHLLQTSKGNFQAVCGICALAKSNEVHSFKRVKFDGPKAEEMRLAAVKWRKEHPELGPK